MEKHPLARLAPKELILIQRKGIYRVLMQLITFMAMTDAVLNRLQLMMTGKNYLLKAGS